MVTILNKTALRRFKRRAREHYPKEYMEVVIGLERDGVFFIVDLEPAALKQAKAWVDFADYDELIDIEDDAREEGLERLGTVHSHPDCYPVPSEADNIGARDFMERIFGIYEISKVKTAGAKRKFRTKLQWWPPQHPLPVAR